MEDDAVDIREAVKGGHGVTHDVAKAARNMVKVLAMRSVREVTGRKWMRWAFIARTLSGVTILVR